MIARFVSSVSLSVGVGGARLRTPFFLLVAIKLEWLNNNINKIALEEVDLSQFDAPDVKYASPPSSRGKNKAGGAGLFFLQGR